MSKTVKWLIMIDISMALICLYLGNTNWLYSSQIAFWSSAFVLGASMFSYRQAVYSSIENGATSQDDRDMIDKMEDPHDLYSDDEPEPVSLSTFEALKSSKTSLSLYRLGSYLLLFVGFFYLTSNEIMHVPSYMIALALPIVIIVTLLLRKDRDICEDSS